MPAQRLKPTSMEIDPDLWYRAKRAAAASPMTLREYVTRALEEKLKREQEKTESERVHSTKET